MESAERWKDEQRKLRAEVSTLRTRVQDLERGNRALILFERETRLMLHQITKALAMALEERNHWMHLAGRQDGKQNRD